MTVKNATNQSIESFEEKQLDKDEDEKYTKVMTLSVKVHFWRKYGPCIEKLEETHLLEINETTTFADFVEKIKTAFSYLKNYELSCTWRDSEGDEITFSSDEELVLALRNYGGGEVFSVSVRIRGQKFKARIVPRGNWVLSAGHGYRHGQKNKNNNNNQNKNNKQGKGHKADNYGTASANDPVQAGAPVDYGCAKDGERGPRGEPCVGPCNNSSFGPPAGFQGGLEWVCYHNTCIHLWFPCRV